MDLTAFFHYIKGNQIPGVLLNEVRRCLLPSFLDEMDLLLCYYLIPCSVSRTFLL